MGFIATTAIAAASLIGAGGAIDSAPPAPPTDPLEAGAIFDAEVSAMLAEDPARWAGSTADPSACVPLVVTWDDGATEEVWQCYASIRPASLTIVYGELDAEGVPTGDLLVYGLEGIG